MRALRIAIVGCGRMGSQHAATAARLGHRVVIACDLNMAHASALAAKFADCRVLTEPAEIPWSTVDAGFVCTPPCSRGPTELAAARQAVPLFLEKPVGLSAEQCRPALAAFTASGTMTSVGYMNRYRASVQRARHFLANEGALGFLGHWVGAPYRVSWWDDPALSGGQLNEQCTHLVDLARYLVGEIAEVSAWGQPMSDRLGANASVSIQLRFQTGALGAILCGCLANEKQIGCRVFTRRGQVMLDGWDFRLSSTSGLISADDTPATDVFGEEVEVFLTAVQAGEDAGILSDLGDALKTQRAVDQATAALRAARPKAAEWRAALVR